MAAETRPVLMDRTALPGVNQTGDTRLYNAPRYRRAMPFTRSPVERSLGVSAALYPFRRWVSFAAFSVFIFLLFGPGVVMAVVTFPEASAGGRVFLVLLAVLCVFLSLGGTAALLVLRLVRIRAWRNGHLRFGVLVVGELVDRGRIHRTWFRHRYVASARLFPADDSEPRSVMVTFTEVRPGILRRQGVGFTFGIMPSGYPVSESGLPNGGYTVASYLADNPSGTVTMETGLTRRQINRGLAAFSWHRHGIQPPSR